MGGTSEEEAAEAVALTHTEEGEEEEAYSGLWR